MQVWKRRESPQQNFHHGVVTVGNFDGLHLGHQSLFRKAQEVGGPRVVITFDPHPMQVVRPERELKRLFPRDDLIEQLPVYGVDLLWILPFDKAFAALPANEFLQGYLGDPFRPKHVVSGYDFTFGSGREGTLDLLRQWGQANGVEVHVLPPLRMSGEVVSSRRIRDLILRGDVHAAHLLLGRPFYLRGSVIPGAGRGKTIGVPTLNQQVENETLPQSGVYATRVKANGQRFASVTNIGTNPTFESGLTLKVETHVLGQQVNLNGTVIDVEFIERLREEKKFSGIADLKKQIQSDILKAKAILEAAK
jgi:riboflavin kinase/FMN adenylyltransferase